MDLPWPDAERGLLATILFKDEEELTAERLEGAVRALRRIQMRRLEEIQHELRPPRHCEPASRFCRRRCGSSGALMDPSLAEQARRPLESLC